MQPTEVCLTDLKYRLRYTLRAGTILGKYNEPRNFRRGGGFFSGGNYNYDMNQESAINLTCRAGALYTPVAAFRLSGGLYMMAGQLNGAGIWGSIAFGKVATPRHRRHKM